ncbi:restriction endonuclease subunit S [Lactobacillus gasseri]|uniref:restriction endonuclease subunit S n=1 Tax=Lactobacillus gasseri TaxID=1596 RepID=UPI00118ECCC0|nr:restriction endonuclease subunit S [Lactobacillus gasseri]TVU88039.1 restriction endonuclease subunit S [Lactobacillus gasseri]
MTKSYVKLGELASYINGYAFKPKDRGTDGLPIIRIQDLTGSSNDRGFYKGNYPSEIEINTGDVLISWSASLGVYIWNNGKALLNQHIFKVVFDKKEIDKDYFVYAVQFSLNKMKRLTHGATMKHVVKKDFENVLIPYPSLEEQRKIAYVLDKLKISIGKKTSELNKLDELIKVRFVEMFGDPRSVIKKAENTISEIADVQVGIVIKPSRYYSADVTDTKVFRSLNVLPFKVNKNSDWVYFSKKGMELNQRTIVHAGDILIVRSGNPGTACIVSDEYDGCNVIDLIIAHPNLNKILPEYLCAYTNLPYGKIQIQRQQRGVAQKHFNVTMYKNLKILVPPLSLQSEFANFVHQVDKSKVAVQKSLDETQKLFDNLMQEYFG